MNPEAPVEVVGAGLCTALGLSARSTFAAFRAGLLFAEQTPTTGRHGGPLRAAWLRALPRRAGRHERMTALAAHALDDLLATARFEAHWRVGAFVGAPEPGAGCEPVLDAIGRALRPCAPGLSGEVRALPLGRSAFFGALETALAALAAGACDAAVVGGVDSLCAEATLRQLDVQRRLLGPTPEGVIPGEGAGFVLLARRDARRAAPGVALGAVLCAATGFEARGFHQAEPNAAAALTAAIRAVRTHPSARGLRADVLYTCETGEGFWAQEFVAAYLRNGAVMPEPFARTMAAESFGDLGAAAGAVMLGVGALELARRPRRGGPAPTLLVCGSSDGGHVGACLLRGAAREAIEEER